MTFLGLLSPLVATALGWLALDQALTVGQVGGALVVLGALAVVQRRPTAHPPGSDDRGRSRREGASTSWQRRSAVR